MNKRGRPRRYNRDKALSKIVETFWRKGFSATSMDELVTETDMNKPSLYAAFGNKQAIYDKAVDAFNRLAEKHYSQALAAKSPDEPLLDRLARYYHAGITLYTGEHGKLGCMVLSTAVAEADNPEIQYRLPQVIDAQEAQVLRVLQEPKNRSLLTSTMTVQQISQIIVGQLHSLSLRARAGYEQQELNAMVDATLLMLKQLIVEHK